ncbi:MAG: histidine phosphatase family protein [Burkholderiales bacterium]|nr:phosphoglycerate mutase family protein [Burkholderiales bacterium]MDE1928986.1 histidine phosphatase family protein [Burkholderiales bacterium]MDE2159780.1 histidine phosphatase family protein [Burkholderiales bacterium]MDE2502906.1 histidine phosphatase family protein [Burkholderiales bacterium]
MRLIFVRHGQTPWNLEGRYQGRADIGLAPQGLATARGLGSGLQGSGIGMLLASPLRRAGQTAAVIGAALGALVPRADARLIEIDFGAWEGLTQLEIKQRWPQALRRWKQAPADFRFPGGESLGDAFERLRDFLHRPPWADAGLEGDVLAVSHAGPIRLAALWAEGRPLADFRAIAVHAGETYAYEWQTGGALRRVYGGQAAKERS